MNEPDSATSSITASTLGGSLRSLLMADDIAPGSDAGYELCKVIYLYHPLGRKMAETPLQIAQSQRREIAVQGAPDEAVEAFEREWDKLRCTAKIRNVARLARIYGIASVVAVSEGNLNKPLDLNELWKSPLSFNVLDPLNTAGSLVLSQIPTARDFNAPIAVTVMGTHVHPTRSAVVMNEDPIYLAYTSSGFGFVGRSVYQRALYPLKSFIRSMMADDMISTKLGLLVAKQKSPGSLVDKMMMAAAAVKRAILRDAQTGQVLSIGVDEEIETLNMMNVDGAGTYARTNIIKNTATAADMPAKLLDNETMVSGFGEGTEDAKNIARYIDSVRDWMQPTYEFFDKIVMHRAWNPDFYARMQALYPEYYQDRAYEDVLSEWIENFEAQWPSLLIEPESEAIKVEDVKLQGVIAFLQTLLPELDLDNKLLVIQWAVDNISDNKMLFPHDLEIDISDLKEFLEEQQAQLEEAREQSGAGLPGGPGGVKGNPITHEEKELGTVARRFGSFRGDTLTPLQRASARLEGSDTRALLEDIRRRLPSKGAA